MSTTWLSDKALAKSPSSNPKKIEILIKIKLIRNLIFRIIFLKMVISRIKHLYVCLDVRVNIIRVFFNFRFPSRKSQGQKKNSFNKLQLTWHWKHYAPATQAKAFLTFQIFQRTSFCHVSEKIFVLRHFLTHICCIIEAL